MLKVLSSSIKINGSQNCRLDTYRLGLGYYRLAINSTSNNIMKRCFSLPGI